MICRDVEDIVLKNVRLLPARGTMIEVERTRGLEIAGGSVPDAIDTVLSVAGENSGGIRITGMDMGARKHPVVLGPGVPPDAVVVK